MDDLTTPYRLSQGKKKTEPYTWLKDHVTHIIENEIQPQDIDNWFMDMEERYRNNLSTYYNLKQALLLLPNNSELKSELEDVKSKLTEAHPYTTVSKLRLIYPTVKDDSSLFIPRNVESVSIIDHLIKYYPVLEIPEITDVLSEAQNIKKSKVFAIPPPNDYEQLSENKGETELDKKVQSIKSFNWYLFMNTVAWKNHYYFGFMHNSVHPRWIEQAQQHLRTLKKYVKGYSSLERTPQYLRICHRLGLLSEEQWRAITTNEEMVRFCAMDLIPIVERWLDDFVTFIRKVKQGDDMSTILDKFSVFLCHWGNRIVELKKLRKFYTPQILQQLPVLEVLVNFNKSACFKRVLMIGSEESNLEYLFKTFQNDLDTEEQVRECVRQITEAMRKDLNAYNSFMNNCGNNKTCTTHKKAVVA